MYVCMYIYATLTRICVNVGALSVWNALTPRSPACSRSCATTRFIARACEDGPTLPVRCAPSCSIFVVIGSLCA